MPLLAATLLYALCSVTAQAQLPLNIEELQVDRGVLKLDAGLTVGQNSQLVSGLVRAAPGSAGADIPVTAVALRSRDSVATRGGLRYGLGDALEINATLHSLSLSQPDGLAADHNSRHSTLQLGASYQLAAERDTPALLLSLSVDALQWGAGAGGNNWHLLATVWRSLEPVVLSLDAGYVHRGSVRQDGVSFDPGDRLLVSGRLNFAVNHRVTLIGGLGMQYLRAQRRDGLVIVADRLQSDVQLGVGLAPGRRSTVFVHSRLSLGRDSAATVTLDWHYRF